MMPLTKDKQYKDYTTFHLKLLRWIPQLWVVCHIWPNAIEHITEYFKQNGSDFSFIQRRVAML